ncbi:hypothetical protein BHE74_00000861 [Ensete ventricosum]|nr:hypothetical protein BHE74_00000861 [Ensete ventricosum]
MPTSARAEKRVANPTRISTGKKCSANAAICAATSGDSSGTWYSLRNSGRVEAASRGSPNWNVPPIRSMAKPSTLVCPDFQNTAAMEKRATKAMRL